MKYFLLTASLAAFTCGTLMSTGSVLAAIEFDQNVTNNAIFGGGNANGSYTTDRTDGVELGLRGKLRHNASGAPENTFNSNGDGTYSFDAGVAPTQSSPTAVWSFEWSINSNYDGNGGVLDSLTYTLSIDSDPSLATNFISFDPINDDNPSTSTHYWDHSIGDNSTAMGAGAEAPSGDVAAYETLIATNNLAQNSWKPHWFIPGFDPTVDGTYDFVLSASNGAETNMQVIVGQGGVPEPVSFVVWSLIGLVATGAGNRRR